MKLNDSPNRNDVLDIIISSSLYGNLGLFIGAGVSKTVLTDIDSSLALSWKQLIEKIAQQLQLDYDSITKEGKSYPEIATQLCQQLSEKENISYQEACGILKKNIAKLTLILPRKSGHEVKH